MASEEQDQLTIERESFMGVNPAGKTPEDIEWEWFSKIYRGDERQLTLRAVIMGMVLGGFMSLSNLYIGLKTGWGLGVALTACILSYSLGAAMSRLTVRTLLRVLAGLLLLIEIPLIYRGSLTQMGIVIFSAVVALCGGLSFLLGKAHLLKSNLSILENNCMQTTASSAGYSTGGAITSAISALLIIEGHHLNFWVLFFWTIFLALLGLVMTIPMKRQMINVEQLKFPSGVAGAQTLRALYAKGEEASKKATALLGAAGFGALIAFIRDNEYKWYPDFLRLPNYIKIPAGIKMFGHTLHEYTLSWENSAIMIAAGALIGLRTGWSMLLGGIVNYGILAPWIFHRSAGAAHGDIVVNPAGLLSYRQIVDWSLWFGASVMVTSGLLTFAFSWRTIGRAFSGLKDIIGGPKGPKDPRAEAMDKAEIPGSWFVAGIVVAGAGCVFLQVVSFSIAWWMGIISVLLTFFLSIVACRATGETDITPIGAMGKITQLTYGILAPASKVLGGATAAMRINLMTAAVTAGGASTSADLLTGLKTGYLLGANPRKQFLAQFWGIFAGAIIIVPAFFLLVPNANVLGSDKFPAPSAQVWKGVAMLLSQGLSVLSMSKRWSIALGGFFGIILACCDRFIPAKFKPYYPSAMGIGLSFVIPFWNVLSMFTGAFIVWIVTKKAEKWADDYVIPIASGVIAGESLMGVFIAISGLNFGEIWLAVKTGIGLGGHAAATTPLPHALTPVLPPLPPPPLPIITPTP